VIEVEATAELGDALGHAGQAEAAAGLADGRPSRPRPLSASAGAGRASRTMASSTRLAPAWRTTIGQPFLDDADDGLREQFGQRPSPSSTRLSSAISSCWTCQAASRRPSAPAAPPASAAGAGCGARRPASRGHRDDALGLAVHRRQFAGALGDRAGQRAHRSDALGQLVVQFAGDAAALGLELRGHPLGDLALGFEPDVVVDRGDQPVGHAVERARQAGQFGRREDRQPGVEAAGAGPVERLHDQRQRAQRADQRPARRDEQQREQRRGPAGHRGQLVPGVDHRARGVGRQHQRQFADRDPALDQIRRDQRGERARCAAPDLVGRPRRAVAQCAAGIDDAQLVGADAAERTDRGDQPVGIGDAGAQRFQHLLGNPGRRLEPHVDAARVLAATGRQARRAGGGERGQHQADPGMQAERAHHLPPKA
jgi:hypothetical protein